MQFSEKINLVGNAVRHVQSEANAVIKSDKAGTFKYADLTKIIESIKDLCGKYDLSIIQDAVNNPSFPGIIVTTLILHNESGQWISGSVPIAPSKAIPNNGSHCSGSMLTYGRRYSLAALFMITQEDDDGNYGNTFETNKEPEPKVPFISNVQRGINEVSYAFDVDDKLTAITSFNAYNDDDRKNIYGQLKPNISAWLRVISQNQPKVK